MALSQGTYVYYDLKGDGRIQMSLITVGKNRLLSSLDFSSYNICNRWQDLTNKTMIYMLTFYELVMPDYCSISM